MTPAAPGGRRGLGGALAAAALLASSPAPGRGLDPRHRWRTLETPHFQLHFHEGEESLARRFAAAAERAHQLLVPVLGHAPRERTQLVLSDDADEANGFATVVPYNAVHLFATPPESLSVLNDYRDWVFALVAHEYVHVLHMDSVAGVPGAFDSVFGKLWVPNGLLTPWLVEGLAVLHEAGPGTGRNSSALFDMYARAAVAEPPGLFRLDVVSNQPLDWPLGTTRYLFGGRFLAFLQERYGDEALAAFVRDQADQVWPYLLGTLAARHFGGRSFDELWREFGDALRERYRAQLAAVRRRPVTEPRPLTRRGGLVQHPRWSPDGGTIAYFDRGLDERPGLRLAGADGADRGRAAALDGNGTLALPSSREALVAETGVFREYRAYDDLHLVDLESGGRRRVTYGERATDPDVAPDGVTALYVARTGGGEHALRRVRLDGGGAETLLARPGAQIFSPRVSPDGRRIAVELHEGGRRDIAVLEGGELHLVTDDDALDTAPSWSPDGRWLFFSSDRSGIYNVYAWAPADGASAPPATGSRPPLVAGTLRQVTNVESGAFEPQASPDGRTLLFVTYSRRGYDLATVPLDPSSWLDPAPAPPAAPAEDPEPPPAYPAHGYRDWETLGPSFWLPVVGRDSAGTTLGVLTGGADVVGRHQWLLEASYSLGARDAAYDLAYAGGWLHPALTLASRRFVGTAPGYGAQLETVFTPLEVGLVASSSQLDRAHFLTLSFRPTWYRAREPAPLFPDGVATELVLGAQYQGARRYVRSISPEEGGAVGAVAWVSAPSLGSDFSYAGARAFGRTYLRVPGTHLALALRAAAGAQAGTIGGRLPFSLGGVPAPDLLSLLLGTAGAGSQLRGYPSGAFAGTVFVNGNLELRFPLLAPQRGYSTWPLFLRRLHGALFLDAGNAYVPRQGAGPGRDFEGPGSLHFGAGAEITLEAVLGYFLRTDIRLGVARGLGRLLEPGAPRDPLAEWQVYLAVGPGF